VNVDFQARLLARRRELADAIARAERESRAASEPDARDPMDRITDDTAADEALQTVAADSATLELVDDALSRIDHHTYGFCILCGKPIEPARLEAIPWTPYCLADQQALEKVKGLPTSNPTL
jgi:DnaK suppressor protein